MSAFRTGVNRLADVTEHEIVGLYGRYERGQLDRQQFVTLGAALIARARVRGVALADLALTAEIIRALRERFTPLGLRPPTGDNVRLRGSVTSVLEREVNYEGQDLVRSRRDRLARLARDSSIEAATWAMGIGMQERGARGWVRVTDPNPCPVCTGLADGVVRGSHITMKRHTGCACVQQSVW